MKKEMKRFIKGIKRTEKAKIKHARRVFNAKVEAEFCRIKFLIENEVRKKDGCKYIYVYIEDSLIKEEVIKLFSKYKFFTVNEKNISEIVIEW